jgi:hypothetical protein
MPVSLRLRRTTASPEAVLGPSASSSRLMAFSRAIVLVMALDKARTPSSKNGFHGMCMPPRTESSVG